LQKIYKNTELLKISQVNELTFKWF